MLNAVFCAIRSPNLRIPSLKLLGLTVAFSIAGCNQEPFTKTGAVSASSAYQCGENDYRSFEKLSVFQRMDSYVPRAKHTEAQRLALDPGTALWHMPTQPQLTCNAQNHLEMRYAVIGASDFANAHDRIIVEIAPAGRLLDAVMLQRLKAVAGAANEALTTLRTKNCSKTDAYEGCDLKVNPDPSLFRKTPQGQIIYEEFPSVGLRAWFRFFKHDDRYATKTVFTTADSKFDVSFLIESKDVEGTTHSSFGVVVELLSSEYDLSSYTKSSASKEQK